MEVGGTILRILTVHQVNGRILEDTQDRVEVETVLCLVLQSVTL